METRNVGVVVFPETVPGDELLFPLVQVFAPIVHCRCVEEDEVAEILVTPLAGELAREQRLRSLVPAPLGEERDRFLALVRDLNSRGEEYALQLKELLLASIGRSGESERRSSIIGQLAGDSGHEDDGHRQRRMVLWQARLLLKLAEMYDSDQRELEQELERIREREEGLLSQLRQEQEQPFGLTRDLNTAATHTDGLVRLRLKAWSRLFCLGEGSACPEGLVYVTKEREGLDLLLETAERLGAAPEPWLRLLLPARGRAGDLAPGERLRREALFRRLLEDLAKGEEEGVYADPAAPWASLLEEIYPAQRFGRRLLVLYRCTAPACDLFMEAFGRDGDLQAVPVRGSAEGCLVGCLQEP